MRSFLSLLKGKTYDICNGQQRNIPYAVMKASVSTVILIFGASVFLALGDVDLDMYTLIVYLYIYTDHQ